MLLLILVVISITTSYAYTLCGRAVSRRTWLGAGAEGKEAPSTDLRQILQKAQDDDAAWLQSVLGETLVKQMISSSSSSSSSDDGEVQTGASEPAAVSEEQAQLSSLGYTEDDVALIKPSALKVIIGRSVPKPRSGIPEAWLATYSPPAQTQPKRRPRPEEKEEEDDGWEERVRSKAKARPLAAGRGRAGSAAPATATTAARGAARRGAQAEGEGESFSWRSRGALTPEEQAQRDRVMRRSGQQSRYSSSNSGGPQKPVRAPFSDYYQRSGQRTADGSSSSSGRPGRSMMDGPAEDGSGQAPTTFWPDLGEFRSMLLSESKWRVELLGGWLTPFVRDEARWRYGTYKKWLSFLDEGLGDGFDVVEGAFGGDEEDEGEEGRGNRGRGSPSSSRRLAQEYNVRLREKIPSSSSSSASASASRRAGGAGRDAAAGWQGEGERDPRAGTEAGTDAKAEEEAEEEGWVDVREAEAEARRDMKAARRTIAEAVGDTPLGGLAVSALAQPQRRRRRQGQGQLRSSGRGRRRGRDGGYLSSSRQGYGAAGGAAGAAAAQIDSWDLDARGDDFDEEDGFDDDFLLDEDEDEDEEEEWGEEEEDEDGEDEEYEEERGRGRGSKGAVMSSVDAEAEAEAEFLRAWARSKAREPVDPSPSPPSPSLYGDDKEEGGPSSRPRAPRY